MDSAVAPRPSPTVTPTPRPLVTCIIVFLNGAAFIREAIDSVTHQTYEHWELLLVDDGSTDGSTEIARACAGQRPGQIRYFQHDGHDHRGECASRNLGISRASGEYVAFLDADDVLLPRALEEEVSILSSQPDVALVYGRFERWYSWTGAPVDAGRDFVSDPCVRPDARYEPAALLSVWLRNENALPANCSTMFRHAALRKAGGFDEPFGDAYEDLVLLSKIVLTDPVYVTALCWSRYRQHPGMSSLQRERTGQWHGTRPNPIRLKYLTWLEGYLAAQHVEDRDLRRLLRSQLLPYRHPIEHRMLANTGRLHIRLRLAISNLGRALRGRGTGSLVAHPNPIRATNGSGLGKTTLSWTSSNAEAVEVHVGAPDGLLFSRSGASGSATTDEWVADGMAFYLQDVSGGRPLSAANTLDIVNVSVASGDDGPRALPARALRWVARHAAPPWKGRRVTDTPPVGRVRFGDLARRTPISRDWGFDRGRPVSRYYIERFLDLHAGDIFGRVAEFGDDTYTRRFGGDAVTRRDVINVKSGYAATTIVADLADAPQIPSEVFDCVICTQTLQLIYDLRAAVHTLHRILKPGGVVLATVPGIGPTCGSWRDSTYWKFTPLAAGRLFEDAFGAGNTTVHGYGNALTAIAFLHGLVTEDLSKEDMDCCEDGYEISITIRAIKPFARNG